MSAVSSSNFGRWWLPRDEIAASRLARGLTVAGVLLHGGLLLSMGPAIQSVGLQVSILGAQCVALVAISCRLIRVPPRAWAVTAVVVTPIVALTGEFYPTAGLATVPVGFMLVVYASKVLGVGVARVVTAEAVGVSAWSAAGLSQGWVLATVHALFAGAVMVIVHHTLVQARDNQDRLVAQLRRVADVDGLTGLVVRRVFEEIGERALQAADPVSLLLVDVDRFKQINDDHGHPVGDDALRHISSIAASLVRAREGAAGRLGG